MRQALVLLLDLAGVGPRPPVESQRVLAVHVVAPAAAARVGAAAEIDAVIAAPVHAAEDGKRVVARLRRLDGLAVLAAEQHLGADHVHVLGGEGAGLVGEPVRELVRGVHHRRPLDMVAHRLQQPGIGRQQAAEEIGEQVDRRRRPGQVPARIERPLVVFRRNPLEDYGEPVVLLDRGERHPGQPEERSVVVVEQHRAEDAVVDLAQPRARVLLAAHQHPAHAAHHLLDAPAFDLAQEAAADLEQGGDARFQVGGEHQRVAHRARHVVEDVLAQPEVAPDPDRRHVEAFLVARLCRRREPARRDRAGVALVAADLGPGDQLALPEDRHGGEHVHVVDAAGELLVEEEDVAVGEPDRGVVPVIFQDVFELGVVEQGVEVDAGPHHHRIARGGEDAAVHVAGDDPFRDRKRHVDVARLLDDRRQLVGQDVGVDVVQERHAAPLDVGHRLQPAADQLGIAARPPVVNVAVVDQPVEQAHMAVEELTHAPRPQPSWSKADHPRFVFSACPRSSSALSPSCPEQVRP